MLTTMSILLFWVLFGAVSGLIVATVLAHLLQNLSTQIADTMIAVIIVLGLAIIGAAVTSLIVHDHYCKTVYPAQYEEFHKEWYGEK